jgi:hypothetical protein
MHGVSKGQIPMHSAHSFWDRLLRRIAPSTESPQVIQKGTDPIDVLWDIKRSMDMACTPHLLDTMLVDKFWT